MSDRFDDFSKNLSKVVSRREALRVIGSGLIGTVLALFNSDKAEAKDLQKKCTKICSGVSAFNDCFEACLECKGNRSRVCFGPSGGFVCCDGICVRVNEFTFVCMPR